MKSGLRVLLASIFGITASVIAGYYYFRDRNIDVLQPSGSIGVQQRDLIVLTSVMMFVVILIVWGLCFWIALRYRADNKKAQYAPDWDSSKILESIWWGIPIVLIGIISVMTYNSSHNLDPFRPIESDQAPTKVQVVALQWKWLFILPDQGIASINSFAFPVDRPVEFFITSDAPMNSFWIPALGGQIYAMSGMSTKLYLDASSEGVYNGYSANISGKGFANMKFAARAMSEKDYASWASDIASLDTKLTLDEYNLLAKPSDISPQKQYAMVEPGLYNYVVSKYLLPVSAYPAHLNHSQSMHMHGGN